MLWATQVADIVKASGDDLLTFKVNDNTALDVLLRKIKDLLLQYTYDLHGAFMVAVQALVHPENIHLQVGLNDRILCFGNLKACMFIYVIECPVQDPTIYDSL